MKSNQHCAMIGVIGHVLITDVTDDTNIVTLVDNHNAVHPQNMARIFARALANEPNHSIYRVALGNGGTIAGAGNTIIYKTPNDGITPDTAGWQSRLYNETYSEVIDDQSNKLGSGLGTSPGDDPVAVPNISGPGVRSEEQGLTSVVLIDVTLNANEPNSQLLTDNEAPVGNSESEFMFDELGLFSGGKSYQNTSGYQTINLANKNMTANTGLAVSTQYTFTMAVNGGAAQTITLTTPAVGTGISGSSNYITYGDILPTLNVLMQPYGVVATISDSNQGINTGGNLILTSVATGPNSSVVIDQSLPHPSNWLFNHLLSYISISDPVNGDLAGVQNNASDPTSIRERLLTHIIFSPILKAANRTIRIKYTLTVAVARTEHP